VPPLTEFAWRHRLVRPVQGRTLAGVCGAFARATGTDPVLWRVVLAVLTVFGGVGVMIYLIAWLALPADGDTATPVEALAGRGRSRTSSIRTIIGLLIVAFSLAGYLTTPFGATPFVAIVLLGLVLVLLLRDRSGAGAGLAGPPPVPPIPPGTAPHAPYGPFTMPPVPPTPGARWPVPPPVPPRPRSALGGLTVSVALVVLGGLIAADLVGVSMPALAYVAAPLAVIGAGLVIGAWIGRARWLIPLGLAFSLALGGGYVAIVDGHWIRPSIGSVTYAPTSVADIKDSYSRDLGDIELDLTDVDFSGRDVEVAVRIDIGSVRVELPSDVDVVVDADVSIGDARVLDQQWSGVGNDARTVNDLGRDGAGGGHVHLTVSVGMGDLEVDR